MIVTVFVVEPKRSAPVAFAVIVVPDTVIVPSVSVAVIFPSSKVTVVPAVSEISPPPNAL